MTVFMVDEAFIIDLFFWRSLRDQLSTVGAVCRQHRTELHPEEDNSGRVRLVIAMDLKQLRPATWNSLFFASDPDFVGAFSFRVLRQSKRLAGSAIPEEHRQLDAFTKSSRTSPVAVPQMRCGRP